MHIVCLLVSVLCVWLLGADDAAAQNDRTIYVPITFYRESLAKAQASRTSACLQIKEVAHSRPDWWKQEKDQGSSLERAFKSVIDAIKRKDRAALYALTDPSRGRDPGRFDGQAKLFFEQFQVVEISAITHTYEFDNLAVLFAQLRMGDRTGGSWFAFAREADGSFGFLPYSTQEPAFLAVTSWAMSPWGLQAADKPTYCDDDTIKRATYRVPLASPTEMPISQSSYLYLAGASFNATGKLLPLVTKVKAVMGEIESARAHRDINQLIAHMTEEGGKRLKKRYASFNDVQRQQYWDAAHKLEPIFLFDASPVIIVYSRKVDQKPDAIRTMYFTFNDNNQLVLTNESQLTDFDLIFKQGSALYKMASQPKPFVDIEMKQ